MPLSPHPSKGTSTASVTLIARLESGLAGVSSEKLLPPSPPHSPVASPGRSLRGAHKEAAVHAHGRGLCSPLVS